MDVRRSRLMRYRALRYAVVALAYLAILLNRAPRAEAAPFDPAATDWEGCSKLLEIAREELGPSRVQVVEEIDYEKLGPADGLLLLHPQGSFDIDELATFMKLGGRLAIVDDFGDGDRLLDRFRIARGPAPSDPLQMLHGNPQLPIAIPSSGHPIVADVAQVVLNHPTTVKHPDLSTLLRVPRAGGDAGPDVALAGQVGEGRLVAIGDPSMFINSMIRFPGNRAVAKNLVAYLLEGGGERKRDAKLTIAFGKFKERGTLGGGITGSFRDRLRGLFSAIDAVRRGGFGGAASRVVALGIATAAAIWVAVRAGSRTKIPRPRYAGAFPDAAAVGRGMDDPRLSPLYVAPRRRFGLRRSGRASPAGVQVLVEALDAAINARPELAELQREKAMETLATEAGLAVNDVRTVTSAFHRLRGAAAGFEGAGAGAWAASRREITLFGRVLAPVADSLRAPR